MVERRVWDAEVVSSNLATPTNLDTGFEPTNNRYMPIIDKEKAREYQRLYHLRTWEKRKTRHKILKLKRERELGIWLSEYKKNIICTICGESYPGCLDFHHKNPEDKVDTISDLVSRGYGMKTILREIKKCVVVCKNCHVKLHDGKVDSPV